HILESTIGIRLDESSEKVALLEKYKKLAPRAALESLRGDNSFQAKNLADEVYGKDKTQRGDLRLGDVYDAYQESTKQLPSEKNEKS
ncbi:hypothetical protein KKH59_05760, partial [Patescibacteria group bacterium]|nr:hypothetical protein [Patescibacteria group bacterium]